MHDHHRRPSPEISRRSRVRRHPETGDWMILWDIFQIMGFSLGFVYCIHLYTVSIFFYAVSLFYDTVTYRCFKSLILSGA
jgi:hypothetical protein